MHNDKNMKRILLNIKDSLSSKKQQIITFFRNHKKIYKKQNDLSYIKAINKKKGESSLAELAIYSFSRKSSPYVMPSAY